MYERNNIGLCLAAIDLVKQGGAYSEHSRVANEPLADCQGFVELALQAVGIDRKDYTGSNAMLRQMVHSVKAIDSNMQAGDIVFWVRKDDKEHEKYKLGGHRYVSEFEGWNATHVGIYLGHGYMAESASSIGHWAITELKKRGETHYAKHNSLQYVSGRENEVLEAIKNIDAEEPKSVQEAPTLPSANYAYLDYKTEWQNLRELPDMKSGILAKIYNGDVFEVLQQDVGFGWAQIRYQGLVGYIGNYKYKLGLPAGFVLPEVVEESEDVEPELEYSYRAEKSISERLEEIEHRLMILENKIGMGMG